MMRALLAMLLLAGLPASAALAADLQPVPSLQSRVTDTTGTLTAGQQAELEGKLAAFEQRKGAQIALLIVATTQPEAIEQYSLRVVEAWKLGRKNTDDGALLLVALQDRTLRIEVGYGLEGALPDATANRIIDEVIKPMFRQGDIYGGVSAGLARIMSVVDGEPLPPPDRSWHAPGDRLFGFLPFLFFGVLVVGGVLRALLGRTLGSVATGGVTGGAIWLLSKVLGFAIAGGVLAGVFALVAGLASNVGSGRRGGGGFGGFGGLGGGGFAVAWVEEVSAAVVAVASAAVAAALVAAAPREGGEMLRILRHLLTPFWVLRLRYPPELLKRIEVRVGEIERRHPGEVRFAVEHALELGDLISGLTPRERALEVFGLLRVWIRSTTMAC